MPVVKPALRNPQARMDIENAVDFYLPEAPLMVDPFIGALEKPPHTFNAHLAWDGLVMRMRWRCPLWDSGP